MKAGRQRSFRVSDPSLRRAPIEPDTIARHIDEERRGVNGTIYWDLAFLASGRFESVR